MNDPQVHLVTAQHQSTPHVNWLAVVVVVVVIGLAYLLLNIVVEIKRTFISIIFINFVKKRRQLVQFVWRAHQQRVIMPEFKKNSFD